VEAVRDHAVNGGLPFGAVGQVKDDEVILRWGASGGVTMFDGELEVIGRVGMTKHDAIKAFVIFKGGDDLQAESVAVEAQDFGQMVGWSGDT